MAEGLGGAGASAERRDLGRLAPRAAAPLPPDPPSHPTAAPCLPPSSVRCPEGPWRRFPWVLRVPRDRRAHLPGRPRVSGGGSTPPGGLTNSAGRVFTVFTFRLLGLFHCVFLTRTCINPKVGGEGKNQPFNI